MTDPAGLLPWLEKPLSEALRTRRAHALLVHGPQGVGQFELALALAQAWLCDTSTSATGEPRPCGVCASCKLVQSRTHPDLMVVVPEALRESLGWGGEGQGDDGGGDKAGKAKPSKEIKVDAVRAIVAFAQTTSARGRGKVVVLNPAERMNAIAANTLLKTLEEPAGDVRFALACADPDALLPTIRSRCQALPLVAPPQAEALPWLVARGVARADVLLRAAGGQPLEALEWSQQGMDAELWLRFPALIARGEAAALTSWPLPRLVDALQKLCHDMLCAAVGAPLRYFAALPTEQGVDIDAVTAWSRALATTARHAEHPWHAALLTESLVQQARDALSPAVNRGGVASRGRATL